LMSRILRAVEIKIMHKQAYIHDGHVDSRTEEQGAVCGTFSEERGMTAVKVWTTDNGAVGHS
jgi:hypothetical protein